MSSTAWSLAEIVTGALSGEICADAGKWSTAALHNSVRMARV